MAKPEYCPKCSGVHDPLLWECPPKPQTGRVCDKQYGMTEDTYGYCSRIEGHSGPADGTPLRKAIELFGEEK
jgi:hypothetical protein